MGFLDWLRDYTDDFANRPERNIPFSVAPPAAPKDPHYGQFWEMLWNSPDPHGRMLRGKGIDTPLCNSMMIGTSHVGPIFTFPQTSSLVMGPPRTAGKTSGVLIPQAMFAHGPLVAVTTKFDIALETMAMRSRLGKVYAFAPGMDELIPEHVTPLRYDPLVGCEDYGIALDKAKRMVATSAMAGATSKGGGGNSAYFQTRAQALLAAMFHIARTKGYSIVFVCDLLTSFNLGTLKEWAAEQDKTRAGVALSGILMADHGERSGIIGTASAVLDAYQHPGADISTTDPNFNAADFVAGRPRELVDLFWSDPIGGLKQLQGRYDTIYVIAENSASAAPLVADLLGEIQRAAKRHHALNAAALPTHMILDELAYLPVSDLPQWLAYGGSQGLLISAAMQDIGQARVRWDKEAPTFMTLFNNVLLCPGIRDKETLDLACSLGGKYDNTYITMTESDGKEPWSNPWLRSEHVDRRDHLPPDVVSQGLPGKPDFMLWFGPRGWTWIRQVRYYEHHPVTPIAALASRMAWGYGIQIEGPKLSRGHCQSHRYSEKVMKYFDDVPYRLEPRKELQA